MDDTDHWLNGGHVNNSPASKLAACPCRRTEVPYYQYTEVFDDSEFDGVSFGRGTYEEYEDLEHGLNPDAKIFSVWKSRPENNLWVIFHSQELRHVMGQVFPSTAWTRMSDGLAVNVSHLLNQYDRIADFSKFPTHIFGCEHIEKQMQLFLHDCFADPHVFSGLRTPFSGSPKQPVTRLHMRAMARWSITQDLDEVEDEVLHHFGDRHDIPVMLWYRTKSVIAGKNEALGNAIKAGADTEIEFLLEHHPDLVGPPALEIALTHDQVQYFFAILHRCPAQLDYSYHPVLRLACRKGYLQPVKALIERGARAWYFGNRPLLRAAVQSGELAVVTYILKDWSHFKREDFASYLSDALFEAVRIGSRRIALYLVSQSDLAPGHGLYSAWSYAIDHQDILMMQHLTTHASQCSVRRRRGLIRQLRFHHLYAQAQALHNQLEQDLKSEKQKNLALWERRRQHYSSSLDQCRRLYDDWPRWDAPTYIASGYHAVFFARANWPMNNEFRCTLPRRRPPATTPCPLTTGVKVRARQRLAQNMVSRCFEQWKQLVQYSRSDAASLALDGFINDFAEPQVVYRRGISSIRKITNGKAVFSLKDVFACIEVARAMKVAVGDSSPSVENLANDVQMPTDEEFQRDIAKWSQYILQPDLELFHEIAQQLWGWVPSKKDCVIFSHEEMAEWLQRLQDVLGELVTATANTMRRERKHRNGKKHRGEGRRLDVIQAENMKSNERDEMSDSPIPLGTSALVDPGGPEDDVGGAQSGDPDPDLQPKVQGEVVVLVNGAIFGVIIAFLLIWRYGSEVLGQISTVFDSQEPLEPAYINIARNCRYIVLYLFATADWYSAPDADEQQHGDSGVSAQNLDDGSTDLDAGPSFDDNAHYTATLAMDAAMSTVDSFHHSKIHAWEDGMFTAQDLESWEAFYPTPNLVFDGHLVPEHTSTSTAITTPPTGSLIVSEPGSNQEVAISPTGHAQASANLHWSTSPASWITPASTRISRSPITGETGDVSSSSAGLSSQRTCGICGKISSNLGNLNKHIKDRHGGPKFVCRNGCGKKLSRKCYRDTHEREKCSERLRRP